MTLLLVALAGGLGAGARFLVDSWLAARLRSSVPTGTVVVNVTGSLALGLLTGWVLRHGGGPLVTVVGTGFLGGYTTFSTASVEAVRLARGGRAGTAFAHAVGMVVLSLAAALAGLWLTGP